MKSDLKIESKPILFDATSIPPTQGGVARFICGLLKGFEEVGYRVNVVAKPADIPRLRELAPTHNYIPAASIISFRPLRLLWEQVALPNLAKKLNCTVIHSPHYTFPLLTSSERVVTLHDATFFSSPELHSPLKRAFFRRWIRLAIKHASRVVTVSEATASEICRFVSTKRHIDVAHLGVDTTVFKPPSFQEIDTVRKHLGLSEDQQWIAFLGTIEPRKNLSALINAHQTLCTENAATPLLIISGSRGWDESAHKLLDDIAQKPTSERTVIEAGYLPLELLSAFLGGAELVVYPSLGEGFGLPVLEAMACATAVLTTKRLSIPEVGGDSVAYSEPDAESLTVAIRQLLRNTAQRHELKKSGFIRSSQFTWRECAKKYAEVYNNV